MDCDEVADNPVLMHPDSTGYPLINGQEIQLGSDGLCMVSWNWDDQILYICDGSYEILRKWFVRDMCAPVENGVNPIEHYQIIKVLDTTAPIFKECPEDIVVSSDPWSCSASYTIPNLADFIEDDCGGLNEISVTVTLGTVIENLDGSFRLTNMAAGDHLVKIRAKDFCSNYGECSFTITVKDLAAPQVVCIQNTIVGLTSPGVAKLYPSTIDNGSYDGCSDILMQIYRQNDNCDIPENTIPGDFVEFCCADLIDTFHMVTLRVWDDADGDGVFGSAGDQYGECDVQVRVEEKTPPSVVCPTEVTIHCDDDKDDLSITGSPSLLSSCEDRTLRYEDVTSNLDDCGIGFIIRVWTVDGTNVTCAQRINVEGYAPFDGDINWPNDFDGDCLDNVPVTEPVINGGFCDLLGWEVDVDTFNFTEGVCYKILRNYTVIDWCTYDTNNPAAGGVWTHTQIIKISDNTAPTIDNCEAITADILTDGCIGDVEVSMSASDMACGINAPLTWTYQIDTDWDGDFDIDETVSGDSITVVLEELATATYDIVWKVFDGCGNVSSCTQVLTVRDGKAPTPYCYAEIVTVLMEGSESIAIWATDFNLASIDNCTSQDHLLYSFSGSSYEPSATFTCADIENGIAQVFDLEMWVTDEAGNQDFCMVQVEVQDNQNLCADSANGIVSVEGRVATEDEKEIDDVEIIIETFYTEYPLVDSTDAVGEYSFPTNPANYNYELSATRNSSYFEGVSTLDLILIQDHILSFNTFTSPYKVIAADINDDEKVSSIDIVQLRKLVLGVIDTIGNDSWRFIDSDHEFVEIEDPFPFPEVLEFDALTESVDYADFVAVKIGDVNSSYTPGFTGIGTADTRSDNEYIINVTQMPLEGDKVKLEFRASETGVIKGLQAQLSSIATISSIESGSMEINSSNMYQPEDEEVRIAWNHIIGNYVTQNEILFSLDVDVSSLNDRDIKLMSTQMRPEIYIGESNEIRDLKIQWIDGSDLSAYALYQNEPNPFVTETNIGFSLAEESNVSITIYDATGKIFKTIKGLYSAGEHKTLIKSEEIPTSGVLFYKLVSGEFESVKSMIKID